MPHRPARRCKCGRRSQSTPCPVCIAESLATLRALHPDSGRGGYDHAWRLLAAEAIELQPWCSQCGATTDLTGDHKDPRKRKGLTLADVQVLCGTCNRKKSGRVLDVYRGR